MESANVNYFLGESVMEPDQRIEVNQKGFCPRHFKQLYDAGNRLGLGLMTHTYMKETIRSLKNHADQIKHAAAEEAGKPIFKRIGPKKGACVAESAAKIADFSQTCVLCERLNNNMERYIYTILYMYRHEAEFPALFAQVQGHVPEALSRDRWPWRPSTCPARRLQASSSTRWPIWRSKTFERLEKELEWFTLQFDYRNEDKPWGNSRDAVKRSVNKLREQVIE